MAKYAVTTAQTLQLTNQEPALAQAKISLTRLFSEAFGLPACSDVQRFLIRVKQVSNMRLLSYIIIDFDRFLKTLEKSLGTSWLHQVIHPQHIQQIEHLAHFAHNNNLNVLDWQKTYSFKPIKN